MHNGYADPESSMTSTEDYLWYEERTKKAGRKGRKPVLSEECENEFVNKLKMLSQIGINLTQSEIRKYVFKFAVDNNLTHNFNMEKGMAGDDWFIGFVKRHPGLPVIKNSWLSRSGIEDLAPEDLEVLFRNIDQGVCFEEKMSHNISVRLNKGGCSTKNLSKLESLQQRMNAEKIISDIINANEIGNSDDNNGTPESESPPTPQSAQEMENDIVGRIDYLSTIGVRLNRTEIEMFISKYAVSKNLQHILDDEQYERKGWFDEFAKRNPDLCFISGDDNRNVNTVLPQAIEELLKITERGGEAHSAEEQKERIIPESLSARLRMLPKRMSAISGIHKNIQILQMPNALPNDGEEEEILPNTSPRREITSDDVIMPNIVIKKEIEEEDIGSAVDEELPVNYSSSQQQYGAGKQPTKLGRKPVLSMENENRFVSKLLILSKKGINLTKTEIQKYVYKFAVSNRLIHNFNTEKQIAGYDWFRGFIQRHPEVSYIKEYGLSRARLRPEVLEEMFASRSNEDLNAIQTREQDLEKTESKPVPVPPSSLKTTVGEISIIPLNGRADSGSRSGTTAAAGKRKTTGEPLPPRAAPAPAPAPATSPLPAKRKYTPNVGAFPPGRKPVLSEDAEELFVQRLVKLSSIGVSLTQHEVRKYVFRFAEDNGLNHSFNVATQTAGQDWFQRFVRRHPELCFKTYSPSNKGTSEMTPDVLDDLVDKINKVHSDEDSDAEENCVFNDVCEVEWHS